MTPQRNDIIARKDEILRITIDQYIDTVTPVSSARIAKKCSLDLSSATIRNILAELEHEGYLLRQPLVLIISSKSSLFQKVPN